MNTIFLRLFYNKHAQLFSKDAQTGKQLISYVFTKRIHYILHIYNRNNRAHDVDDNVFIPAQNTNNFLFLLRSTALEREQKDVFFLLFCCYLLFLYTVRLTCLHIVLKKKIVGFHCSFTHQLFNLNITGIVLTYPWTT